MGPPDPHQRLSSHQVCYDENMLYRFEVRFKAFGLTVLTAGECTVTLFLRSDVLAYARHTTEQTCVRVRACALLVES